MFHSNKPQKDYLADVANHKKLISGHCQYSAKTGILNILQSDIYSGTFS